MSELSKKQLELLKKFVAADGKSFSTADTKDEKILDEITALGLLDNYDCMWGRSYYRLTDKGMKAVFK